VLPVSDVCAIRTPEEFLNEAVLVYTDAARRIGSPTPDLEQRLHAEGARVLSENAGTGYRGPLVKVLAAQVMTTTKR
jgi:hypothetical protein